MNRPNMTYAELAERIAKMSPEEKQLTVTVYIPGIDEYYPINDILLASECDVLDANHPFLSIANEGEDPDEGLTPANF